MPDGIEVRQYLQDQPHTYITTEQAEAITAEMLTVFPCLAEVGKAEERAAFRPRVPKAEETYPLVTRHTKTIRTRVRNDAKKWVEYVKNWDVAMYGPVPAHVANWTGPHYSEATINKHKRAEEIERMLHEIDTLRYRVEMLESLR